ncbi:MAG TPA: hypothetical protein VF818_10200 [Ktedonobacterales bacterium]
MSKVCSVVAVRGWCAVHAVVVVIIVAPVPRCGHVGSVEWQVGRSKGMGGGSALDGKVVDGDDAMCRRM